MVYVRDSGGWSDETEEKNWEGLPLSVAIVVGRGLPRKHLVIALSSEQTRGHQREWATGVLLTFDTSAALN